MTGTIGDDADVQRQDVPGHQLERPGNGVGHTFSIPTLGINVPLYGNNGNANLCAVAPCTDSSSPHNIVKFSFDVAWSGPVSLAVLRPLRARLPVRQRRSDVRRSGTWAAS